MKIQTNSSGSRSIEILEEHLQTIEKYQLLRDLIDSNGYVDEQVLDKAQGSTSVPSSRHKQDSTETCSTFALTSSTIRT